MQYSWILFDLDNTLYDFDAASDIALRTTFLEYGVPDSPSNIQAYKTINKACWDAFEEGNMDFATLKNSRFERLVQTQKLAVEAAGMGDRYLTLLSQRDDKIDGAITLLEHLQLRYQLAVVTNGLQVVKRPQLSKPEIAKYFQAIIISEEIGVAKPQRGFFEHTFKAIGQPAKARVLIVGDNLNSDVRGGYDFGIDTCWFNPHRRENHTTVRPTYEIHQLNDLLKIV